MTSIRLRGVLTENTWQAVMMPDISFCGIRTQKKKLKPWKEIGLTSIRLRGVMMENIWQAL